MKCTKCGKEVNDTAKLCEHCGARITNIGSFESAEETNDNKIVGEAHSTLKSENINKFSDRTIGGINKLLIGKGKYGLLAVLVGIIVIVLFMLNIQTIDGNYINKENQKDTTLTIDHDSAILSIDGKSYTTSTGRA